MWFKYKPSKRLVEGIIPAIKDYVRKIQSEEGIKHEDNPQIRIIDIQKEIREGIYDSMLDFWKDKKIKEKVPIIQNGNFIPLFLMILKKEIDPDEKYSENFYTNLPKEMLNHYSGMRYHENRFDILVSNKKKDLELLIKKERKTLDIKNIEKDNKWIVT